MVIAICCPRDRNVFSKRLGDGGKRRERAKQELIYFFEVRVHA
jgi:hypothetical protein